MRPDQVVDYKALVGDTSDNIPGVKGVGQKTAETLAKAFGADVYRVLEEEPERVRDVLPEGRANRIIEGLREETKASQE